jgi:ribosomal protein S18 acetylase RimI-like enzyme
MSHPIPSEIVIAAVVADRRAAALRELFGESPLAASGDQAALFEARQGELTRGVLGAWSIGSACGAILLSPGAIGLDVESLTRLIELASRHLFSGSVKLVRATVGIADFCVREAFTRCGYQHVADVKSLMWDAKWLPVPPAQAELSFAVYQPAEDRERLASLLAATFVDSLDVPELNDQLAPPELIEAFATCSPSTSQWWWIANDGSRDVGCVLLADHGTEVGCEITYLGLIPDARGRGWGRELVYQAQQTTVRLNRQHLLVSIDAANERATRMFQHAGFSTCDNRVLLFRRRPDE